jgi:hypothetical protein
MTIDADGFIYNKRTLLGGGETDVRLRLSLPVVRV